MSKRADAVSMLHGHAISIQFDETAGVEHQWYLGCAPSFDAEDTHPWEHRVRHPLVSELLLAAIDLDPSITDYPWMPEPDTTLKEALTHLSTQGSLGIQGGILYWEQRINQFTCVSLGGEIQTPPVVLNWKDVAELVKANYKLTYTQPKPVRRSSGVLKTILGRMKGNT